YCVWFEPEVEVFGLVDLLYILEIVPIELRHFHEDVVVHLDAVLILLSGFAVFGKRAKPPRLKHGLMSWTGEVCRNGWWRRVPLKRKLGPGIRAESVVVRRGVIRVGIDGKNCRRGILAKKEIIAPMHIRCRL